MKKVQIFHDVSAVYFFAIGIIYIISAFALKNNSQIKLIPEMLNLLGCNKENFKKNSKKRLASKQVFTNYIFFINLFNYV